MGSAMAFGASVGGGKLSSQCLQLVLKAGGFIESFCC